MSRAPATSPSSTAVADCGWRTSCSTWAALISVPEATPRPFGRRSETTRAATSGSNSGIHCGPGKESPSGEPPPSHDAPLPQGDRNLNPAGIGLVALVVEDYRTHDRKLLEPGFMAIAIHRFGNARMDIRPRFLRALPTAFYRLMYTCVNWFWGIDLDYTVRRGQAGAHLAPRRNGHRGARHR